MEICGEIDGLGKVAKDKVPSAIQAPFHFTIIHPDFNPQSRLP